MDLKTLKTKTISHLEQLIESKVDFVQKQLDDVQGSANNETKSSAGDKHETGRAMAQLEKEKAAKQLETLIKQKQVLFRVQNLKSNATVQFGSMIRTETQCFFLSIGLGEIEIEGHNVFCISPVSPIGQSLKDKKPTDSFLFGTQTELIVELA